MQSFLSRFSFSKHSMQNTVPSILKQGRFTRKGFTVLGTNRTNSQNWIERRLSRTRRPVDLTNVNNSHLYYDHQAETQKRFQQWQQRKEKRLRLLEEKPTLDYILQQIKNHEFLANGSWHLLFGLKLLHIHYPTEIIPNRQHILYLLKRVNLNVRYLDIHNFRSLVSFSMNYTPDDKDVWQLYLQNCVRIILSHEQQQKPLLSVVTRNDIRRDFLKSFHSVVDKAFIFQFNFDNLICQLDLMMRNHYREIKQLNNPPPGNTFKNLSGDEASIFFSDFIRIIQKRSDIYNDYDRQVKFQQVKQIALEAQQVILETMQEQTVKSQIALKLAFENIDPKFCNNELKKIVDSYKL